MGVYDATSIILRVLTINVDDSANLLRQYEAKGSGKYLEAVKADLAYLRARLAEYQARLAAEA